MKFLKILFFVSVAILFFAIYFHNIIEFDQDLGRHLLMGKIILATGSVPKTNLLSYTYPNFPFINTHWLSEVFFYKFSAIFGVVSLLWAKIIICLSAMMLTVFVTYKFSKNILATAVSFAIFVPVLLERTEIRPEIFSFLFTAIFLYIFLGKNKKLLWLLPILEIVWVNSHIYFIIGPIIAGIFLLQNLWEQFQESKKISLAIKNSKSQLINTALIFAATLVNPNGLSAAVYPFTVLNSYGYSIVENQNIFFLSQVTSNQNIFYFAIAAIAFAVSFLVSDLKKLFPLRFLFAALTILPIMAIRSFPFFFLLELPFFAFNLANIRPGIKNLFPKKVSPKTFVQVCLILIICLTSFRTFRLATNQYYLSTDSNKRFGSEIDESGKGALDFVIKNDLHGPIFNNFDIGSYIDYRLFPKDRVFVDGRPEAYPVNSFQNIYIPMQMTAENFAVVDKLYNFNLIVFAHTDGTPWASKFLSDVINNKNYSLVYLDDYAVVFVKTAAFPQVAKTYKNFQFQTKNTYVSYLYLAKVSDTFGWKDQSRKFLEQSFVLNHNSPLLNRIISSPTIEQSSWVIF